MSTSITITGATGQTSQLNQFQTTIPEGSNFNNMKIGVSSFAIAYSWPNINAIGSSVVNLRTNGNFQYVWYQSTGAVTVTCTAPNNSFWETSDLNAFLHAQMLANKHYLVDSTNNPVYFMTIENNRSVYGIQINCTPIPTSLGTYTYPSGATWTLPATASTPQLIVPSPSAYNNNTFGSFIGVNAGTYPAATQTTFYSKVSDFTPTVSPVSTVLMTSNLCNNKMSSNRNVVFTFTPSNTSFGEIIVENDRNTCNYYDCIGQTNSVQVSFYDQNWNPLTILDPASLVVTLTIKPKNDAITLT